MLSQPPFARSFVLRRSFVRHLVNHPLPGHHHPPRSPPSAWSITHRLVYHSLPRLPPSASSTTLCPFYHPSPILHPLSRPSFHRGDFHAFARASLFPPELHLFAWTSTLRLDLNLACTSNIRLDFDFRASFMHSLVLLPFARTATLARTSTSARTSTPACTLALARTSPLTITSHMALTSSLALTSPLRPVPPLRPISTPSPSLNPWSDRYPFFRSPSLQFVRHPLRSVATFFVPVIALSVWSSPSPRLFPTTIIELDGQENHPVIGLSLDIVGRKSELWLICRSLLSVSALS